MRPGEPDDQCNDAGSGNRNQGQQLHGGGFGHFRIGCQLRQLGCLYELGCDLHDGEQRERYLHGNLDASREQ